jgi:WD and tetratricopeptide repeat-containing protein 1
MFPFRDGDLYAALRDCHAAIHADPNHLKAHFRLARCLYELSWTKEAADCLLYFKNKFPDYAKNPACEALDRDINAVIQCRTEQGLYESEGIKLKSSSSTKCGNLLSVDGNFA